MIIRLLILGILKRRGSAHGYRMYRDLVEWRVETWTIIRPGSIYHALTQMEKQGLIIEALPTAGQKSGPAKTEYKLTIDGEKEFTRLLESALKDINLIELSVGIAFMAWRMSDSMRSCRPMCLSKLLLITCSVSDAIARCLSSPAVVVAIWWWCPSYE